MPRTIVVNEYTESSVKLGGDNVRIVAAWFGLQTDASARIDVTEELQAQLRREGCVWLSASSSHFGNPAPWRMKQLVVTFEGDNEYSASNAIYGAFSSSTTPVAIKGGFLGVVAAINSSAVVPALIAPVGWIIPAVVTVVGGGYICWKSFGSHTEPSSEACNGAAENGEAGHETCEAQHAGMLVEEATEATATPDAGTAAPTAPAQAADSTGASNLATSAAASTEAVSVNATVATAVVAEAEGTTTASEETVADLACVVQ
eukprot:TRINITY_DN61746_c0_g1_i1.p1 TRINITY_DN61746_c0_g1~~TRINITY_DN61746_c0_g1_i1.p1  ORF type:complete len:267 (-),score=46.08 TRINITY_DN61746_c0_g1_i1:273-1052(-)